MTVKAAVVGSGPNGLAAAVTLARAGCDVTVFERASYLGGALASRELTEPGFLHDVGAAVPVMATESEFFRRFEIFDRVPFVVPEVSYAHPFEHGPPALAYRDIARTAENLGVDGPRWASLLGSLSDHADRSFDFAMNALLRVPPHPMTAARFGIAALEQGTRTTWDLRWREARAPALLTGSLAHVNARIPSLASAGAGLLLAALAHRKGWPIPVGGAQAITDAMVADLRAHGGEAHRATAIDTLRELDGYEIVILNCSPREFLRLASDALPIRYRRRLERFAYGRGVAKVDFALAGPIPWRDAELSDVVTVHLGGTREEIVAAERDVRSGKAPAHPFILLTQPTVADPSRAPRNKHVAWAYTHVPPGSRADLLASITDEIERYAPGFRDLIIQAHSETAVDVETRNPNFIGGDISAGDVTVSQLVRRPTLSRRPWATPLPGVYLASGSTSPGPSIHGLAGYRAAMLAVSNVLKDDAAVHLGVHP